jgi:ribosome biogenesis protein Tsr3
METAFAQRQNIEEGGNQFSYDEPHSGSFDSHVSCYLYLCNIWSNPYPVLSYLTLIHEFLSLNAQILINGIMMQIKNQYLI